MSGGHLRSCFHLNKSSIHEFFVLCHHYTSCLSTGGTCLREESKLKSVLSTRPAIKVTDVEVVRLLQKSLQHSSKTNQSFIAFACSLVDNRTVVAIEFIRLYSHSPSAEYRSP